MKIISKIKRELGTNVTLDGVRYHFGPENDHTCEVENPRHIERFLSIPEGFTTPAKREPELPAVGPAPAEPSPIESMGKNQLKLYASKKYGVTLAPRMSVGAMRDKIHALGG